MNIKLFNIALGVVLTTISMSANAQKSYSEGVITYSTEMRGQPADVKLYFTPDSSAEVITAGPAIIKILHDAKHTYLAVVLDVAVANMKKAGIATPADLEAGMAGIPSFTYTPTTETKQISGFNCKKVIAKEAKSGKTFDVWITNDISVPPTAFPFYYSQIGGVPIQFTSFEQGQQVNITYSGVSPSKAPKGTFGVSKEFEKVSLSELSGG